MTQLSVDIRLNTNLDPTEIAAFGADHLALATGSQPDPQRFQRAMTHLPGIDRGRVLSPEDILTRAARPGKQVIVVDEGGNWRGAGTAWWLAEQGHAVTIATPDPMVGKELQSSAADVPLRRKLAALGVRFVVESAVQDWLGNGGGAEVLDLLTGAVTRIPADDLVMATANRADEALPLALNALGIRYQTLDDQAAPRMAALAFHDGRKWAQGLPDF